MKSIRQKAQKIGLLSNKYNSLFWDKEACGACFLDTAKLSESSLASGRAPKGQWETEL